MSITKSTCILINKILSLLSKSNNKLELLSKADSSFFKDESEYMKRFIYLKSFTQKQLEEMYQILD